MPTIFDRLASDQWAIYCDHVPNTGLIRSLAKEWLHDRIFGGHFRSIDVFDEDCRTGRLPAFSFIEPIYLWGKANDGHPPRDMVAAERLLARIYLSLRQSPRWEQTLFVLLYDEHGGFFDHVSPPTGVPAPDGQTERGFAFRTLGIRVPALLICPYVPKASVWRPPKGSFADHTSLLATVLRRWEREPLTARDAAAADVWSALSESAPRTDDSATVEHISRWYADQQVVVRSWEPGAETVGLGAPTGREMALAVVAAGQVHSAGPMRGGPLQESVSLPMVPARDIPLDQALITLAGQILALPD